MSLNETEVALEFARRSSSDRQIPLEVGIRRSSGPLGDGRGYRHTRSPYLRCKSEPFLRRQAIGDEVAEIGQTVSPLPRNNLPEVPHCRSVNRTQEDIKRSAICYLPSAITFSPHSGAVGHARGVTYQEYQCPPNRFGSSSQLSPS